MNGLVIRAMQPRDVSIVAEIERESFPCPWIDDSFYECLKYPAFFCYVATREGEGHIVGYTIGACEGEVMHIVNLATAVECRRFGYGRALLRHLLGEAKNRGIRSAFLEVRTRNIPARALYASEGFTQIEFLPHHYPTPPDDGLRLAVEISPPLEKCQS
ncbi:MAG TPA: ribosomal protein S18-alanine N-acetyltransferase [Candidatus Ozemobacteraceae bacterium]|nr:ribosomal protein S18-alanine N-acetyltransferase [Candidatus Ozemobacteraceae bacterium]